MSERRMGSTPPRTMLDVLREQEGGRERIGQSSSEQTPEGFNVQDHVIRKPTGERPSRSLVSPEVGRIMWRVEIIEGYDGTGNLGLIIQFFGISFINPVFEKSSRDYGPDSSVFYSPVGYKSGQAFLILSTFG